MAAGRLSLPPLAAARLTDSVTRHRCGAKTEVCSSASSFGSGTPWWHIWTILEHPDRSIMFIRVWIHIWIHNLSIHIWIHVLFLNVSYEFIKFVFIYEFEFIRIQIWIQICEYEFTNEPIFRCFPHEFLYELMTFPEFLYELWYEIFASTLLGTPSFIVFNEFSQIWWILALFHGRDHIGNHVWRIS